MKSSLVERPPLRVATMSHVGPYPEIGKAFARLEAAATEAGLLGAAPVLVAIFHDNPAITPAESLRSDAGLVVEPGVALPAGLTESWLQGGRYLHLRHTGSYAGLPAAWAFLRERGLAEHGVHRGDGPGFEIYPNNPGNSPVDALVTDIYLPVREP